MADRDTVIKIMQQIEALYEREVCTEIADMFLEDLEDYSNDEALEMFRAHRRDTVRGSFCPKPADLLAKARKKQGQHPEPDVAWAIAIKSFDEDETVVWTKEIEAARAIALPLWETGDAVGARLAFKCHYEAIVAHSSLGTIPKWQVSPGHDPKMRYDAVEQAQENGLISKAQSRQLLPYFLTPIATEMQEIAGLLSGKVVSITTGRALPVTEEPRGDEEQYRVLATAEIAKLKQVLKEQSETEERKTRADADCNEKRIRAQADAIYKDRQKIQGLQAEPCTYAQELLVGTKA